MVDNDQSVADGLLDVKSNDIEELTGDKPKTPEEVIGEFDYIWKDHITNWRQMK
ncbi:hypothetical protein RAO19_05530 [Pediococcus acidilactici]